MSTIRIFGHYIRVPFLILGIAEFVILFISVYLGYFFRFSGKVYKSDMGFENWIPYGLLFAVIMSICMAAMGLYQTTNRNGFRGVINRLIVSYLLGIIILAVVFYIFPVFYLGRGIIIISLIISFLLITISRKIIDQTNSELFKKRILILGTGKNANKIFTALRRKTDKIGINIIGYVHPRETENIIEKEYIVKLNMPLTEYAISNEIDEIVLAIEERRKSYPIDDLLDCKMSGIDVIDTVTFFERETGKIRLDQIRPSWFISNSGFRNNTLQDYIKRIFDIMASLLLLLLTWPFILIAVLAIKIEDGFQAPIIYKQIRVGKNGKPFFLFKFRSMTINAEKTNRAVWASQNDDRVTRVGQFIRKTRIDELPQIFNVLNGTMSFVGPRPERPEFVVKLSDKLTYYSERHRVKPGITGWAQINYPYGASEQDALEKLQYDLYYVKNYSVFLDILILLYTVEVIIFGKGAR